MRQDRSEQNKASCCEKRCCLILHRKSLNLSFVPTRVVAEISLKRLFEGKEHQCSWTSQKWTIAHLSKWICWKQKKKKFRSTRNTTFVSCVRDPRSTVLVVATANQWQYEDEQVDNVQVKLQGSVNVLFWGQLVLPAAHQHLRVVHQELERITKQVSVKKLLLQTKPVWQVPTACRFGAETASRSPNGCDFFRVAVQHWRLKARCIHDWRGAGVCPTLGTFGNFSVPSFTQRCFLRLRLRLQRHVAPLLSVKIPNVVLVSVRGIHGYNVCVCVADTC